MPKSHSRRTRKTAKSRKTSKTRKQRKTRHRRGGANSQEMFDQKYAPLLIELFEELNENTRQTHDEYFPIYEKSGLDGLIKALKAVADKYREDENETEADAYEDTISSLKTA